MAIAAYADRQVRYRVVRAWSGGPPRGAEIRPQANRAQFLLRGGFIEEVKTRKRKRTDVHVD